MTDLLYRKIKVCLLFFFLFVIHLNVSSQSGQTNAYTRQFSYHLENDFFAFRGTDGYYSNGLSLAYSALKKNNKPGILKSISTIEAAHKIYMPGRRQVYVFNELDRPITGHLYGTYSETYFTKDNRLLQFGLSAGVIGNAAQAEKVLDIVHPYLEINSDWWKWMFKYELKTNVGIDVFGKYAFDLLKKSSGFGLQITPVSSASLGTVYTNIGQAVVFQVGWFNNMSESGYWNSRVNNGANSSKKEFLGYVKPQLVLQGYNATVQGGLFTKQNESITSKPSTVVFTSEVGIKYATNRITAGFHINYQSKETPIQQDHHMWGGFEVQYRIR